MLTQELNSQENHQNNLSYKLNQKSRSKYKKEHEEFLNATYNYWTAKRLKYVSLNHFMNHLQCFKYQLIFHFFKSLETSIDARDTQ